MQDDQFEWDDEKAETNEEKHSVSFDYAAELLLGDYVDVYYPQLGIVSKDVEIMSLSYDVLANAVTEMELGQIKTTFAQVLERTFEGGIKA